MREPEVQYMGGPVPYSMLPVEVLRRVPTKWAPIPLMPWSSMEVRAMIRDRILKERGL